MTNFFVRSGSMIVSRKTPTAVQVTNHKAFAKPFKTMQAAQKFIDANKGAGYGLTDCACVLAEVEAQQFLVH